MEIPGKKTQNKTLVHSMKSEPWPDLNWVTYSELYLSLARGKYLAHCLTKAAKFKLQPLE